MNVLLWKEKSASLSFHCILQVKYIYIYIYVFSVRCKLYVHNLDNGDADIYILEEIVEYGGFKKLHLIYSILRIFQLKKHILQLSLTWRKTIQQLLLLGHSFFPILCDIVEMVMIKQIWCISLKIITNL